MKKNAVVLVSGGLDSAVALAMAVDKHGADNVLALNMFYGQKHSIEAQCFVDLTCYYKVEHMDVNLEEAFSFSNCPLLAKNGEEIPHGDYAVQEKDLAGVVKTYVPFRNGLFLSYAAAIAYSVGASEINYGAHADDAMGNAYPDCSEEFIQSIGSAINVGTAGAVTLVAPFWDKTKAEIVAIGRNLNVPFHLTWSCYEGAKEVELESDTFVYPCGVCGTCIDRRKAFELNGMKDPLAYRD